MAKRKTETAKDPSGEIKRVTAASNDTEDSVRRLSEKVPQKGLEVSGVRAAEMKEESKGVGFTSLDALPMKDRLEQSTGSIGRGKVLAVSLEEYNKLKKEKDTLDANLKKVSEELSRVREDYEALKRLQSASSETLQQQVSQLVTDRKAMQDELKLQRARLSSSFTSQELANYLNDAITDFNNKIGQASDTVSYSIGNMDVSLKAQIVKQNDKLGFITTSSAGEAALSEIRFTIAATPRV